MAPLSPSNERKQTPNSVITTLEETLSRLDEYEFPSELKFDKQRSREQDEVVPALLERYEGLREKYLESQIQHGVLEHLKTHDWNTLPNDGSDTLPSVQAQHEHMARELQNTAKRMVSAHQDLQADYTLLQHRKEELRDMLDEFRSRSSDKDWSFSSDLGNSLLKNDEEEDDEDEEALERDLVEQEELILTLQKRKIELEAKLNGLKQEALDIGKENLKLDGELASLEDTDILENENETLQQQLNQLSSIKSEYEHRRLILEELSGIQIDSIEEEKKDNHVSIHVTLSLLREHNLRVTLDFKQRQRPLITEARFLHSSTLDGLYLPPLNDLIPTSQDFCPGILRPHGQSNESAGFRFLVHQALARLETFKYRKAELDMLREICTVQIHQNAADPEDHLFQQVVCVFPWDGTEISTILRLTPDCPCVAGSIFLESLSCPTKSLVQLEARVQSQQHEYSSPLQLLKQIQEFLTSGKWKEPMESIINDREVKDVAKNGTQGVSEC